MLHRGSGNRDEWEFEYTASKLAEGAEMAGILSAPVAAKMFFRQPDEVLCWLETRAYAAEALPKGETA